MAKVPDYIKHPNAPKVEFIPAPQKTHKNVLTRMLG